ncbi:ABC transporter ATP-binding protein [Pseudooceanicola algae]|uniref:Maltose/maltodextrin import ATP-binding protein MalK n=1 Tax=Pseudooceanicola algae TaxID=1537215 RepID=A0A418SIN0_9RHOB|nr:ABC transporter ATP-binding protein [Pseudooceanicola algae]QPM91166.1 Maltose/maltodextrin import ATP-binding protein MalK [Pseudooceanicola algae]
MLQTPIATTQTRAPLGKAITLRGLHLGYDRTDVIADLSLEVRAGEFIALLGASGCGKTTLLRALAGFVPVRQGQILLDDRDLSRTPPETRGMAMMFQSYALWPHMTVAQNIGYGLKLRGAGRAEITRRVAEMAALVGLGELTARKIPALSGGQKQRVALARALAIDPPVLLLDEPLSNLDAGIRVAMRHEIRALQQRLGLTTILVTHDREEAMSMADRVVILNKGQIAQIGTPEQIYHRPANSYVARFMGATNALPVEVRAEAARLALTLPDASVVTLPRAALHAPEGLPTGPAQVMFRSDAAHFDPDPAEALLLRGKVVQHAYLGSTYRHEVEIGALRLMADASQKRPVGSFVELGVPATALSLFPARSQTAATG